MAQQQSGSTCPLCKGGKAVANASGQAQVCPLCNGSGTVKIPGLKYQYATSFIALAGNASAQSNISIVNADFRWMFAMATSTGAFQVQIQDAKTNRNFFSSPQHSALVFGNAQLPFPIVPPYSFNKLGSIIVNVTDLSGAPNTIWIGFDGQELVEADSVQSQ